MLCGYIRLVLLLEPPEKDIDVTIFSRLVLLPEPTENNINVTTVSWFSLWFDNKVYFFIWQSQKTIQLRVEEEESYLRADYRPVEFVLPSPNRADALKLSTHPNNPEMISLSPSEYDIKLLGRSPYRSSQRGNGTDNLLKTQIPSIFDFAKTFLARSFIIVNFFYSFPSAVLRQQCCFRKRKCSTGVRMIGHLASI